MTAGISDGEPDAVRPGVFGRSVDEYANVCCVVVAVGRNRNRLGSSLGTELVGLRYNQTWRTNRQVRRTDGRTVCWLAGGNNPRRPVGPDWTGSVDGGGDGGRNYMMHWGRPTERPVQNQLHAFKQQLVFAAAFSVSSSSQSVVSVITGTLNFIQLNPEPS